MSCLKNTDFVHPFFSFLKKKNIYSWDFILLHCYEKEEIPSIRKKNLLQVNVLYSKCCFSYGADVATHHTECG